MLSIPISDVLPGRTLPKAARIGYRVAFELEQPWSVRIVIPVGNGDDYVCEGYRLATKARPFFGTVEIHIQRIYPRFVMLFVSHFRRFAVPLPSPPCL